MMMKERVDSTIFSYLWSFGVGRVGLEGGAVGWAVESWEAVGVARVQSRLLLSNKPA